MTSAIVVLTRGYPTNEGYIKLIQRNLAIQKHLRNTDMDIVFFHEGNITTEQQKYIRSFTPALRMIFTDVKKDGLAFSDVKQSLPISPTVRCPFGYRHMCAFWFTDFWLFCNEYDRILRIDEDCIIDFDIVRIVGYLETNSAVFGKWEGDVDFVTRGLNDFTMSFLRTRGSYSPRLPSGPYTNVIALNLQRLRANTTCMEFIRAIKASENIYIWRWGDLPLWGEMIHYLFPSQALLTKQIKYFHESHDAQVN